MRILFLILSLLFLSAPTQFVAAAPDSAAEHPEARLYDEDISSQNIDAAIDEALVRARQTGKNVIVVMGANWCHDSRGLAGWFETPRFAAMLTQRYELVYVDAGAPQRKGQARNQHVIKRFDGKKQKNTPYVMIVSPQGKLLNRNDARSWRNAASRAEEDIFEYFDKFAAES